MDYLIKKRIEGLHTESLDKWPGEAHKKNSWVAKREIINSGYEPLIADFEADEGKRTNSRCYDKSRAVKLEKLRININS